MNNTLKSFSIVTVFSVLTRLMSFLFKIWMSRSLGAETVGLYQIALSVILLLFSLTGSAGVVLSRKIAAAAARGDTPLPRAAAKNTAFSCLPPSPLLHCPHPLLRIPPCPYAKSPCFSKTNPVT